MKWLKELIKQDVLAFLFLSFLIGSALLWFTGDFFDSFKLTDGEKVNATVLWLTSLDIFWYAYETYQLKKVTTNQVAIQEEIMLNAFLPILEPISIKTTASGNSLFPGLGIRNLGGGPAKYVSISINGKQVTDGMSLAAGAQEKLRFKKAGNQMHQSEKLIMTIKYQDIYGRNFETNHITLEKNRRAYQLKHGSWDFKRIKSAPSRSGIKF